MSERTRRPLILMLAGLVAACGPAGPGASGAQRPARDAAPLAAPKTLTLAIEGEPGNLVSGMEGGGISPTDFADTNTWNIHEWYWQ